MKSLFATLGEKSDSSLRVNVTDGRKAGGEPVVTQVCNRMNLEGSSIEFDAVVVYESSMVKLPKRGVSPQSIPFDLSRRVRVVVTCLPAGQPQIDLDPRRRRSISLR